MGPRVPGRKDCGSLGDREQPHSLSRLLLSRGHPAPSAPQAGDPSWNHGHPQGNNTHAWAPGAPCPCHTDKAVAPVTETSPGPTCLRCPALSWAGDPAPMDFVLPRAHSHPAPCSGGLAVPAWPQLPQAAAAPCLPPSAVQHRPHHSPPGLGLLGHSHTSASARLRC